jgi:hypothetical protein
MKTYFLKDFSSTSRELEGRKEDHTEDIRTNFDLNLEIKAFY